MTEQPESTKTQSARRIQKGRRLVFVVSTPEDLEASDAPACIPLAYVPYVGEGEGSQLGTSA
jgi:hypothetical protein